MTIQEEKQKVWNFARNLILQDTPTYISPSIIQNTFSRATHNFEVFRNYPNYSDIEKELNRTIIYSQFQEIQINDTKEKGIITSVNPDNTWVTILWEDTKIADAYPRSFVDQNCSITGRTCKNITFNFEGKTNEQ